MSIGLQYAASYDIRQCTSTTSVARHSALGYVVISRAGTVIFILISMIK